MNQITAIQVYSTGSTLLNEPALTKAQDIAIATCYPAGLYATANFTVPRRLTDNWGLTPGQRIKFYSGLKCVWEGRITGWSYNLNAEAQSVAVKCLGYYGDILERRTWWKHWAVTSLGDDVWKIPTAAFDASDVSLLDMYQDDSSSKGFQRWIPRPIAFTTGQHSRKIYTAPAGTTAKRITGKVNLQEAGQQWRVGIYNETTATSEYTVDVSGPATFDITFAAPGSVLWMYYQSRANQTATNFNTLHGDFEYVTIYGETGTIDLTAIAGDVAGYCTEISTYLDLIAANGFEIIPFFSEPGETLASILTRAAGYGDASYNAWAVGIRASDLGTDDKPVMFAEQQPALTDYDYVLRLDDPALSGVSFEQDTDELRNWIAYTYTDQLGVEQHVTPDTDATLKDTESIALYGERHEWLSLNSTDATVCANYARRYLATKKDLQWTASSGIPVTGSITAKSGEKIPACAIEAGKRLRIANWLNDLNGTGLTFLITATDYDDNSQTCTISVGQPNNLDVFLARNMTK